MGTAPAGFLLPLNTAVTTPFAAGELGSHDDAGELFHRIPLMHALAVGQGDQYRLDPLKTFFECQCQPLSRFAARTIQNVVQLVCVFGFQRSRHRPDESERHRE